MRERLLNVIQILRSDDGENAEYDRALLECFNLLFNSEYKTLGEVMEVKP